VSDERDLTTPPTPTCVDCGKDLDPGTAKVFTCCDACWDIAYAPFRAAAGESESGVPDFDTLIEDYGLADHQYEAAMADPAKPMVLVNELRETRDRKRKALKDAIRESRSGPSGDAERGWALWGEIPAEYHKAVAQLIDISVASIGLNATVRSASSPTSTAAKAGRDGSGRTRPRIGVQRTSLCAKPSTRPSQDPRQRDIAPEARAMQGNSEVVLNQCDGCRRGLPVRDGIHYDFSQVGWGGLVMGCTRERYRTEPKATCQQTNPPNETAAGAGHSPTPHELRRKAEAELAELRHTLSEQKP
jgi:hypothetical protein